MNFMEPISLNVDDNILKNIYIIVLLQVFLRSDFNTQLFGNNDISLDSNNSIDELPSNNGEINFFDNLSNNITENQITNFETLFHIKKLKDNREFIDSNIDSQEIFELNNKNKKNEEDKNSEKIISENINDEALSDKIEIRIENENSKNHNNVDKKIIFECIKLSNDKNKIKELGEILVNNNIFGHKLFNEKKIDEKLIKGMKYTKKKRNRRTKSEMNLLREMEKNIPKIESKKGRIKNIDKIKNNKKIAHSKICIDNIIKKIKSKFFEYLRKTVNDLIEKFKTNKNEKYELLKLDYKLYVDQLNKELDLSLLNMPLRKLLSLQISSKYKEHSKDENKKIIQRLLKDEEKNEVINYIMNLTFMEWIYMFRNKKEETINQNIIKFEGIDEVIKTIENKNKEKDYLINFMFALYRYEDWFNNKIGRKKKGKEDY